jgi:hypothetical protein
VVRGDYVYRNAVPNGVDEYGETKWKNFGEDEKGNHTGVNTWEEAEEWALAAAEQSKESVQILQVIAEVNVEVTTKLRVTQSC